MRAKPRRLYVTRLCVTIDGNVPFDMMRSDRCVPATEVDANKLKRIAAGEAREGDRQVLFDRFSLTTNDPTLNRWASFGCTVTHWEPAP